MRYEGQLKVELPILISRFQVQIPKHYDIDSQNDSWLH
jgi:hypothetical protein